MIKLRSLFRRLRCSLGLGLLTCLLVTTVVPALTQHPATRSIAQPSATGAALLDRGRRLYDSGRLSEAAQLWQQAAAAFATKGNRSQQALSLTYLSLTYQDLGEWDDAATAIDKALSQLNDTAPATRIRARALNAQASLQLARGQTQAALETWQHAETAYETTDDSMGVLGSQINQAQAMQVLGLYRRSQTRLESINRQLQQRPDSELKVAGLRSLGITLQMVGNLQRAREILEQSLNIAKSLDIPGETSATLFSLGNTARALRDYEAAFEYYRQAEAIAPTELARIEAQINQFGLLVETGDNDRAKDEFAPLQARLDTLTPSRMSAYARVNLAENALAIARQSDVTIDSSQIAQLLASAIRQARQLNDTRAEAYALGHLGHLYELLSQWDEARDLTQQALKLAQEINANDIAYRWQWQLGRILDRQQNRREAIALYREAVNTLDTLRSDLVAVNPDVQFSFRQSVEPVYRQLVALLVQSDNGGPPSQKNLKQARDTIEALQLAELDNFFRDTCAQPEPTQIDRVDPTAAVIYPIILSDRLAVVVSIPGQPLIYHETVLSEAEIDSTLEQLLQSFNPAFPDPIRLQLSQQVYDWLVRPIEVELAQNQIETLVFVPDGAFKNLPMSALYDGEQYLIERYQVAIAPGLQLLEPRSLATQQLRALMAGLTESRQGYASLPEVATEVNRVAATLPSQVFLNGEFTEENLAKQIARSPFQIVHLATHGQFSSDPEQTYILTWEDRLQVKELERLLQSRQYGETVPIELLVLSACKTAQGDDRAALGLAGIAVRSGARSTIATLWSVKDKSTALLMSQFYDALVQPNTSKARALRQAQLLMLEEMEYRHPFYWSPFVLVGNWL